MADVKETKELFIGVNELSLFLVEVLKDGFQLKEDISAIIAKLTSDSEFRKKLQSAYEGVSAVKEEIKDLSVSEGVELVNLQASYVPKIVEALKKA